MASFSDLYQAPSYAGNALGSQLGAGILPQYRLNMLPQYQQEDAATQMTRLGRGFDRAQYQQNNSGAAKGQWGSSGLSTRADWLNQDAQDKGFDIQTNLARNMADVAQQRAQMFMGLY